MKYQENNDIEIGNWKLADLRNLEYVLPFQLDQYLQMGWFRMGQTMFTTNFLIFNNKQYNTLWLRIDLEKFELTPSQKKLLKQNSRFDLKITSGQIDYQKEDLYYKYRADLNFSIAPSLQNLLTGNSLFDIFDSKHIEIYDNDSLIACGVFDVGDVSAQGIVSVFDPAYRKYSLGKYLFLQKILFLKANGYKYFYPGYFVPDYGQFNYKLDMAKASTSFFDFGKKNWLPMNLLEDKHQPLKFIQSKLESLHNLLVLSGLSAKLLQYNFFDICLVNSYADYGLLDVPMFLYCFPNSRQQEALIIFNVFTDQFQFVVCNKPFQSNINEVDGHYAKFLLKIDTIILQEKDESLFVERLIDIVKS